MFYLYKNQISPKMLLAYLGWSCPFLTNSNVPQRPCGWWIIFTPRRLFHWQNCCIKFLSSNYFTLHNKESPYNTHSLHIPLVRKKLHSDTFPITYTILKRLTRGCFLDQYKLIFFLKCLLLAAFLKAFVMQQHWKLGLRDNWILRVSCNMPGCNIGVSWTEHVVMTYAGLKTHFSRVENEGLSSWLTGYVLDLTSNNNDGQSRIVVFAPCLGFFTILWLILIFAEISSRDFIRNWSSWFLNTRIWAMVDALVLQDNARKCDTRKKKKILRDFEPCIQENWFSKMGQQSMFRTEACSEWDWMEHVNHKNVLWRLMKKKGTMYPRIIWGT